MHNWQPAAVLPANSFRSPLGCSIVFEEFAESAASANWTCHERICSRRTPPQLSNFAGIGTHRTGVPTSGTSSQEQAPAVRSHTRMLPAASPAGR
jgi:hypothetical protein